MELRDPELRDNFLKSAEEGGMGYTEETIRQLEEYVKPEWKKVADALSDLYINELYDRYNEPYKRAYGKHMPRNKYFTPIYISPEVNVRLGSTSDAMLTQPLADMMNRRHITKRTTHTHPLAYTDALDVFNTYVERMERFRNWYEPVQELKHFFKDAEIRESIRQYHGSEYNKIIDWYMRRFEGVDRNDAKTAMERFFDRYTKQLTKGILFVNPTIGLKQTISTVMYLNDMPLIPWVLGIGESLFRLKKIGKEFEAGAFLKGRKGYGAAYFDIDIIAKTREKKGAYGKFLNFLNMEKAESILGANIRIGDRTPMYTGGYAYYKYKRRQYRKNYSEQEAEKRAFEDFESFSNLTQQSTRISNISYLRGSNPYIRTAMMFTSGAAQVHRVTSAAVRDLMHGKNMLRSVRTIAISHVIMGQLFTLIGNNFVWDPKDQRWGLVLGELEGVALLGKPLSYIRDKVLKKPWAESLEKELSPVLDNMDQVIKNSYELGQLWNKSNLKSGDIDIFMQRDDVKKRVDKLAKAIAASRGIPLKPGINLYVGIKDAIKGESEYPILQLLGLDNEYTVPPRIWEKGGLWEKEKAYREEKRKRKMKKEITPSPPRIPKIKKPKKPKPNR